LALRRQERPPHDPAIRVVVHPTDFSLGSETALRVARLLARDQAARLVILHVTPPPVALEGAMAIGETLRDDREFLELVRKRMEGPDLKYPVEARLVQGAAAAGILRATQGVDGSLIVMGTHGRTGLRRVLMGSVAEEVLRGAGCPVLAVKGPAADASVV
jgi:nucleotide-binding universal stress UspA family protein